MASFLRRSAVPLVGLGLAVVIAVVALVALDTPGSADEWSASSLPEIRIGDTPTGQGKTTTITQSLPASTEPGSTEAGSAGTASTQPGSTEQSAGTTVVTSTLRVQPGPKYMGGSNTTSTSAMPGSGSTLGSGPPGSGR